MSTVGSLINRIRSDSLLALIRDLLATDHPEQRLAQLADTLAQQFALAPSEKHMIGRDLGQLAPTPSLKYKAAAWGEFHDQHYIVLSSSKNLIIEYVRFVEEGQGRPSLWTNLQQQIYLGSDEFIERLQSRLPEENDFS
jgi:hypothetical protein